MFEIISVKVENIITSALKITNDEIICS